MNKSPAFQFYPDKWQSHTRRLSDSAYRVYHEVICWMWQHSPDQYSICKDADGIACALAMQPHTICKAIEEIQNPHAPLLKDEGERYISNGLKKEAEKQIENRQKKSKNAHARWDMQKQSGCNAVASIPQCSLIPSLIPSPSPIPVTNKDKKEGSVVVGSSEPTKTKSFKDLSKQDFIDICEKIGNEILETVDAIAFCRYWMEPDTKGRMRFQLQKTWDTSLRMHTWKRNAENMAQRKVVQ